MWVRKALCGLIVYKHRYYIEKKMDLADFVTAFIKCSCVFLTYKQNTIEGTVSWSCFNVYCFTFLKHFETHYLIWPCLVFEMFCLHLADEELGGSENYELLTITYLGLILKAECPFSYAVLVHGRIL